MSGSAVLAVSAAVAIVFAVVLDGFLLSTTWGRLRPFRRLPPGIPYGELLVLRMSWPEKCIEVVTEFYEWRQDQWRRLARGAGAAAVSAALAIVALLLDTDTTVTKSQGGQVTGTDTDPPHTMTDAFPAAVVVFIVGMMLIAGAAWFFGQVLQRRMVRDTARMA